MDFPEKYFSNAEPTETTEPTDGDAACNPILFDLFSRLYVAEPFDDTRDRDLRNAFQHAVTHIAFETINSSRKEPLMTFGPKVRQISSEIVTRIINRVVGRYGAKLWPRQAAMGPLPEWLITALEEYISALLGISAEREHAGESALRVFDNVLGVNQDELQGGFASVENDGDGDGDGDGGPADDGLECILKEIAAFDSCLTTFATAADLERHLIDVHEVDPEDARESARDASVELKKKLARKS